MTRRTVKTIFWSAFAIITIATVIFFIGRDFQRAKPEYTLTVQQLVDDFSSNEQGAQEKYAGKVIRVSGIFKEMDRDDNRTIVLLGDPQRLSGVSCFMKTEVDIELSRGDSVSLTGICSGYLLDVIMDDCSIKKVN